ncbi:heterokaryon incompatibility protein-domain-containing protein [Cercophora newfieldiana]|uniref:Heterokaryon incompatibility protein-domain-containing protein n=1 Tax=Cercophora newfieldiana TaxID=92897 RepID=A0AA39Y7M2_9PEZI|nr:heterokaryon incompatibility protein-domain-containing protein [Cercophora newfieldiana]
MGSCTRRSDDTIEQARIWLDDCLLQHSPDYCGPKHCTELPTRLIEIESIGSGVDGVASARLIRSITLPADTKYTTLSHCWGSTPFFTLSDGNLEEMYRSIPVARLPPAFQDAMSITLKLGQRYIWIDSLCIIQDSLGSADWVAESRKMDVVYGNSYCNLAATGFSDGQQPLPPRAPVQPGFRFPELSLDALDRLPRPPVPESSSHDPPEEEPLVPSHATRHSTYCIVSANDWDRQVSQAPLHRRAWVIQEQMLAPRILHFTETQVFWECSLRRYSREIPQGAFQSITADGALKSMAPMWMSEKNPLYSAWFYLIREYSGADLTRASDKLPAISGLAKIFQRKLDDEYLAGLWKGNIYTGLLWFAIDRVSHPSAYRAPSWSWASVDGRVRYFQQPRRPEHKRVIVTAIEEIATFTERQGDLFGPVSGGHIRLAGFPHQALLSGGPGVLPGRAWYLRQAKHDSAHPDAVCFETYVGPTSLKVSRDIEVFPSVPEIYWDQNIFFLPLFEQFLLKGKTEDAGFRRKVSGLVLRREKGTIGTYTKVGVFRSPSSSLDEMFSPDTSRLQEGEFERKDGEGRYVIRII